jgi:hypothetical protein
MKITIYKSLISLSRPLLEDAVYTGTRGLYSAVKLLPSSRAALAQFCTDYGLGKMSEGDHCTVMCSPKAAPSPRCAFKLLPHSTAIAERVIWWRGNNGKGCMVLALQSNDLAQAHDRLVALGCKPQFTEYRPHITLIAPIHFDSQQEAIKCMEPANEALRSTQLQVHFGQQRVEDYS